MTSIELKLSLPDDLASEATASGLLDPAALEEILREELRRRRANALFTAVDRLSVAKVPPMTEAELNEEMQSARAARRNRNAAGA
ncbi:MAG TPA: hypothetical protein VNT79_11625 [Phycisphaerae bacterium]|nr:hypothetical protein [Phycisphaerae bacterium]